MDGPAVSGHAAVLLQVPSVSLLIFLSFPFDAPFWGFIFGPMLWFYLGSMAVSSAFFHWVIKSMGSQPTWKEILFLWTSFWSGYLIIFGAQYGARALDQAIVYESPALWLLLTQLGVFTYQVVTHPDIVKQRYLSPLAYVPCVADATAAKYRIPAEPVWTGGFYVGCILQWFVLQRVVDVFESTGGNDDTKEEQEGSTADKVGALALFHLTKFLCSYGIRFFADRILVAKDSSVAISWSSYAHFFVALLWNLMYRNLFRSVAGYDQLFALAGFSLVLDLIVYTGRMTRAWFRVERCLASCLPTCLHSHVGISRGDDQHFQETVDNLYRLYLINKVTAFFSLLLFPLALSFLRFSPNAAEFPQFVEPRLSTEHYHDLLTNFACLLGVELFGLLLAALILAYFSHVDAGVQTAIVFRSNRSRALFLMAVNHLLQVAFFYFAEPKLAR